MSLIIIGLLIIIILILVEKLFTGFFQSSIYDKYDYFDYAATTPIYEEAFYYNYAGANQGNLSQSYNVKNRELLEKSGKFIIDQIHCDTENFNILWTSGASEANNTVIKTFCADNQRIIMGNTEHHTSLACIEDNTKNYMLYDFRNLDNLYNSITPDTKLISVMHVNNEIGYIYDLEKIAGIVKLYRKNNSTKYPYLHSDMSQSLAKLPMQNIAKDIDIITASAHKFYGPLGVGMIIFRKDITLKPLIYGTQQSGLRGGTVNYPGILASVYSLLTTLSDSKSEIKRAFEFSDMIKKEISDNFSTMNAFDLDKSVKVRYPVIAFYPNSSPYILSFSVLTPLGKFNNIKLKEKILEKNIIIGTGSACSVGSSTVLNNLSLPEEANQGFIRLSFGRLTTNGAVKRLTKTLIEEIKKMLVELK